MGGCWTGVCDRDPVKQRQLLAKLEQKRIKDEIENGKLGQELNESNYSGFNWYKKSDGFTRLQYFLQCFNNFKVGIRF